MKNKYIICFMGIDGSGKSTLSKYLFNELSAKYSKVTYIWWLEAENSLFRKFLRKIYKFNNNKNETHRENKDKKAIIQILILRIYPILVLLDYFRFGMLHAGYTLSFKKKRIIIYDRYFYDVIYSLAKEFNFSDLIKRRLLKIFGIFLPKPDLTFFIVVPPEIAYLRKKEEILTIENAKNLWENFLTIQLAIREFTNWKTVEVDNTNCLKFVKRKLLELSFSILR